MSISFYHQVQNESISCAMKHENILERMKDPEFSPEKCFLIQQKAQKSAERKNLVRKLSLKFSDKF